MSVEDRATIARRPKRQRSAVTNGKRLFVQGSGRSAWSRRYHDLVAAHASDLGGADVLSEAQQSLVRRASAIQCALEELEGRLSMGEAVDLDVFTRSTSHLRRIYETLGVKRQPRDVTDLQSYIASKYGRSDSAVVTGESDAPVEGSL